MPERRRWRTQPEGKMSHPLSITEYLFHGLSDETYRTFLATQTWPWVKQTGQGLLILLTIIGLDPGAFWMRWLPQEEQEINI